MATNWKTWPVVRLLSSLRVGATLIFLILLYASVFSALPQVRGALELTEMQAFSHWLFAGLILLLCLSVTVATLVRIRFNLINLGVLTVHAGLLILCGGSLWYFGAKTEGDALLRSPKIELLGGSRGQMRPIAALLPEPGQSWSNVMPGLGGNVTLEVVSMVRSAAGEPERAVVRAQVGDAPPAELTLRANDVSSHPLGDRLAVRFVAFPPERTLYDHERAALYFRPTDATNWSYSEIVGLPYFRERYLADGAPPTDTDGKTVPSKRTSPVLNLGVLKFPTGWFEFWRMPIRVPTSDAPFEVEVTGYLPYVTATRAIAVGDGPKSNPALTLSIEIPNSPQRLDRTLFAQDPVSSRLELQTPVELRWAQSPEEVAQWLAPLAGPDELVIEVKDPPITKRVAIQAGQKIPVEGTDYELTIQQLLPTWPLMSPGFEGASSPAALVEVKGPDKQYTRTVIERFPALSQDIDEKGMRRKEGPYDPNLVLRYRSVSNGALLLVASEELFRAGRCELGIFLPSGQVERRTLEADRKERVALGPAAVDVTVRQFMERARTETVPVIEPLERRRPNVGARSMSAIRLKLTGRGPQSGWSESRWCLFSDYPDVDSRPITVRPPGSPTDWKIAYSRLPHDLGFALIPGKLSVNFFPGRRSVETWRSDFQVQHDPARPPEAAAVYTNQTFTAGRWTLFQSGAANDHWSYTIIGVGNRRGIWPMLLGCTMIPLGCLYAFYVKPVLKRRRQQRVLEEVRNRGAGRVTPLVEAYAGGESGVMKNGDTKSLHS